MVVAFLSTCGIDKSRELCVLILEFLRLWYKDDPFKYDSPFIPTFSFLHQLADTNLFSC